MTSQDMDTYGTYHKITILDQYCEEYEEKKNIIHPSMRLTRISRKKCSHIPFFEEKRVLFTVFLVETIVP